MTQCFHILPKIRKQLEKQFKLCHTNKQQCSKNIFSPEKRAQWDYRDREY